ncbi:hypothetical protein VPH35_054262 [Triticum aestivum]
MSREKGCETLMEKDGGNLMDKGREKLAVEIVGKGGRKGAYQVYAQPVFVCYEKRLRTRYPDATFFHRELVGRLLGRRGAPRLTMCKLVLRTAFVAATMVMSLMFSFFNAILGLLGAAAF